MPAKINQTYSCQLKTKSAEVWWRFPQQRPVTLGICSKVQNFLLFTLSHTRLTLGSQHMYNTQSASHFSHNFRTKTWKTTRKFDNVTYARGKVGSFRGENQLWRRPRDKRSDNNTASELWGVATWPRNEKGLTVCLPHLVMIWMMSKKVAPTQVWILDKKDTKKTQHSFPEDAQSQRCKFYRRSEKCHGRKQRTNHESNVFGFPRNWQHFKQGTRKRATQDSKLSCAVHNEHSVNCGGRLAGV